MWKKIENLLDVSAMYYNVLSGFLSLRLGLCSIGDGYVKFKNFIYKPIR
jgi:xylan 1,4-beta-xylosidase